MNYLDKFKKTGALLEGNFILTSALYSHQYMQCSKLLQYPKELEELSRELVKSFCDDAIDVVISPAIGGIVLGTEVGRQLSCRTIFAERDFEYRMVLRRGFELQKNERVLVIEDVVTTGGTIDEIIKLIQCSGAIAYGAAFIVDRSNGIKRFDVEKQVSLLKIDIKTFTAKTNPKGVENAIKPGSRKI